MMTEQNKSDEEVLKNQNNKKSTQTTRISVDLAGLSIEAETEGQQECEDMFNRTWDKILNDAEEMSDALEERMNSY